MIGKLSNDNKAKFPKSLPEIIQKVAVPGIIVGGERYYGQIEGIEMPPIGSRSPQDFYRDFDILLYHNSDEVTETWCRVVTEAMASGLPVVADGRGGPTEQIDHGVNGYLCNSPDEFHECLMKLVDDPKLRHEIGEKARNKVMINYDISRFRRDTVDIVFKAAIGA